MKISFLHGSFIEKEKSLDKVSLSLDGSESQVMRLMQQLRDLQETVNALQDSEELEDPELASCEGQTFTCVSNRPSLTVSRAAFVTGRMILGQQVASILSIP